MDFGRGLSGGELKVLRDVLNDVVISLDELVALEEREAAGETVTEDEVNLAMGKFMMTMLKADMLK